MTLLLDTHTFLWFCQDDPSLSASAKALIEDPGNRKLVSVASCWEIAIKAGMKKLIDKYEFYHSVRGKGLMIAMEFGAPQSLKLKAAWAMLETANKGLFSQMITIPLFKNHRILSQVAGHGMNVVKLLPPLNLTSKDRDWIVDAFDKTIADTHNVTGSIWTLGKNLASHALKNKK